MNHSKKIEEKLKAAAPKLAEAMKPFNEAVSRNTLTSSAYGRIQALKRGFVMYLYLRRGAFFEGVCEVREKWGVTPRRQMPCEGDRSTYYPVSHEPPLMSKPRREFENRWVGDLQALMDKFIPKSLRFGGGWGDFFGACVFCDPPREHLLDFAEFGGVHPRVFWPVGKYGDLTPEEFGLDNLRAMACPPVETVSYEDPAGKPRTEYRIVVDENTTIEDVISAWRGIKSAYGFGKSGGRPAMDELVALQMAIIHDDLNERGPEDRRFKRWTYKTLAARFGEFGVKSERSAEEHVKLGRELRKDSAPGSNNRLP